jgi:putative Holliday junction resolvase
MSEEQCFLGFDYGRRYIGIAVGQSITQSATALTTLQRTARDFDAQLTAVVTQWQPDAFVVGLPMNMDGSEQNMTQHAREFGERLSQNYQRPTYFIDETLSTRVVREEVFAAEGYRGLKKEKIDALSARHLLQQWLSEKI